MPTLPSTPTHTHTPTPSTRLPTPLFPSPTHPQSGDVSGALRILRSEVVPCKGGDLGEVRRLSAGLLCQDASAVAEATGVDAAGAEGRERVLQVRGGCG